MGFFFRIIFLFLLFVLAFDETWLVAGCVHSCSVYNLQKRYNPPNANGWIVEETRTLTWPYGPVTSSMNGTEHKMLKFYTLF